MLVLQLLHPASSEQRQSTDHTSSLQQHVASGKETSITKQQVADTLASLAVAKPAGCDAADQAVYMRCSNDSMPHGDVGLIAEAHSSDLQQRNPSTDNTVSFRDPEPQHQQLAASAEALQQLPQESCRNTCAVFPAALLGCHSDLIPLLSQSSGLVNLMQFRYDTSKLLSAGTASLGDCFFCGQPLNSSALHDLALIITVPASHLGGNTKRARAAVPCTNAGQPGQPTVWLLQDNQCSHGQSPCMQLHNQSKSPLSSCFTIVATVAGGCQQARLSCGRV